MGRTSFCSLFISLHTYLAMRGCRCRGCSAGGGSGSLSSSCSSQMGTRDLLSPSLWYHCPEAAKGVPDPSVVPVRGWYDFGALCLEMFSVMAQYKHHNFMNIASQPPTPVPRATDPLHIVIPPPQVPIPMHKRHEGWRNTIVAGAFSLSPLFFFFFFLTLSHDNDGTDP